MSGFSQTATPGRKVQERLRCQMAQEHAEAYMGLFETNPWLLIPIIILTIEGWTALNASFKQALRKRERV